jgi:hypothetical protein
MRRIAAIVLLLCLALITGRGLHAQSTKGQWCGYALIEGVPQIETHLPILSMLVPDEKADSDPSDLFQYRVSLDGSKAIIEGCWRTFPTRDLIINWLSINGNEKEALDQEVTYSLFAPDGSREDSAASVRDYLSKTIKDWELPEE